VFEQSPHDVGAEVPHFSDLGYGVVVFFETRPWRLFRTVKGDSVPRQARRLLPSLHLLLNCTERFMFCRLGFLGIAVVGPGKLPVARS
jgi:hypothetical protein